MDLGKAVRDPWVWGQLILFLVVFAGVPLLSRFVNLGPADDILNRPDPAWLRLLGGPVVAFGVGFAWWGVRSLGPNLTPGTEPVKDAELVTRGAYAHRRHPIYTGAVLILAGYSWLWSNWRMALLVAFLADRYFEGKAAAEERWLLERFPLYRSYQQQVTRRVL